MATGANGIPRLLHGGAIRAGLQRAGSWLGASRSAAPRVAPDDAGRPPIRERPPHRAGSARTRRDGRRRGHEERAGETIPDPSSPVVAVAGSAGREDETVAAQRVVRGPGEGQPVPTCFVRQVPLDGRPARGQAGSRASRRRPGPNPGNSGRARLALRGVPGAAYIPWCTLRAGQGFLDVDRLLPLPAFHRPSQRRPARTLKASVASTNSPCQTPGVTESQAPVTDVRIAPHEREPNASPRVVRCDWGSGTLGRSAPRAQTTRAGGLPRPARGSRQVAVG